MRPSGVKNMRRMMGTVAVALVAAGCGTASAAHQSAGPGSGSSQATGCAAINQATSLTVHRTEAGKASGNEITQRNVLVVHSLFGQLCAAVTHPDTSHIMVACPAIIGPAYNGTFYDGSRVLATFSYSQMGCTHVSLTAGGKVHSVKVVGTTAAAAPSLSADLTAAMKA